MKFYTEDGWINWDYLYNENRFIMAITGARGTGKTYGLLKYIAEHKIPFIYMRRLKAQLDQCASGEESNPFRAVNANTGSDIVPVRKSGGLLFTEGDGDVLGSGVALSTVATIRGADYSHIECIVFDEYIAMIGERPIKGEVQAFLNFLETVNRNRELTGKPPVKVFMLGNANKLANPYFVEWHFTRTALNMIKGKQYIWRSKDGNRIMIMLHDSPISERKKETALYKQASGDFIQMAIDNSFATDETRIRSVPLTDCRHIVSFGTIGIYQLKSTGEHYISNTISRQNYLPENEINLTIFRARYALLKQIYLYGYVLFESYENEMIFREYLGL